jgi:fumarate hydratase subunit alpha
MNYNNIKKGIVELIRKAETDLPDDVIKSLKRAHEIETGIAKTQIKAILENINLAKKSKRPMCQDTGIQTFFVNVGINSPFIGEIENLIIESVKDATKLIPLRPNTVDPFTGKNNNNNTGNFIPYITWNFTEDDNIQITALPKGGGSENMSKLGMLKPGMGINGVKNFVVDEIINAAGNPCPPTIVGVGIGGGADLALKLGKKSLLRPVGARHKDKKIALIEEELIKRINDSGIGPMGLGGKTTVLDVHIEKAHRHPASLPVGLIVQCWANRRANIIINSDGKWRLK